MSNFSTISRQEQLNEMMMMFILYQTNMRNWIFAVASSLKQQIAGKHVALPGHIILIPRKPINALVLLLRAGGCRD